MIRIPLLLALILPLLAEDDSVKPDLLRLTNGELEGQFGGIDAKGILRWNREDGVGPMEFKTDKIRQIILHGGKPAAPGLDAAHVELVNGDRLPARLIALDDESITLDTTMAGRLVVPKDAVVSISPNPFGGRLIYAGPFSDEGWRVYSPADDFPEQTDDGADDDGQDHPEEEADDEADDSEVEPDWVQSGSKWYFNRGRRALRSDIGMPDQAILRFTLEWRSRPPIAIAFHADFKGPTYPEPAEGEEPSEEEAENLRQQRDERRRNSQHLADYFGTAYVLTLRSSYAQLQQCGFNDEGQPYIDQIRSSATNIRFDDTGKAGFEVRCDRKKGSIALFVNGEFASQWNVDFDDGDGYAAPGSGIGFQMLGSQSPVRISDIVVAEWNGMPDSARSLTTDDQDIVLLTNGTDRFSGTVAEIMDGKLKLEGRYAPLMIPLEDVAEVHFAREGLREVEESKDRQSRIQFQPVGRLSGVAGLTTPTRMNLRSPLLGEIELDLASAVIIEFQFGSSFLNFWDEDL